MREHSEHIGGVEAVSSDQAAITYADLFEMVAGAADRLRSRGIGQGAVVGLAIAHEVEHLVATLALLAVGADQVTLASHDTVAVRAGFARRLRLTHVLESNESAELPELDHVRWTGDRPAAASVPWSATGQATIYFSTSGTTGEMKLVPLSDRQLVAQARRHPDYSRERLLRLGSIEHNISKRLRLYCVYAGGTNVFLPHGSPDVVDACRRLRVTELDISRLHAVDLAARASDALRGVRINVAGSPVPFDVRKRIQLNITPTLTVRYGATECGTIAYAGPGDHDESEVVGTTVPGVELEIVDGEDARVEAGETGHIRVRADGIAAGYFDSPEETRTRFRDGWFYPGDMGMRRADGHLIVQGRSDDMMILNGINVFPAEIERVLDRHPAVVASAALPIASKVHGQIPVAAVELRPGSSVTVNELLAFARENLALRAPRRILVLEAIPRNAQGKVLRREIATCFAIPRSSP